MAQEKLYLYHCDRCGELFKSKQHDQVDIRCNVCGEHPLSPKFNSLSDIQPLQNRSKSNNYEANGKRAAGNAKTPSSEQLRQWGVIGILCIAVISMVSFMAFRMNEKSKRASKSDTALDAADTAYLAKKKEASRICQSRFKLFSVETAIHSKSAHILNGSDLVLDINRYYLTNLMKPELSNAQMIKFEIIETAEEAKAEALYRYQPDNQAARGYFFEVLFRKKGKSWLIDWSHLVRIGETNWFNFSEEKIINAPKRFRLYLRKPRATSLTLRGYDEYKLSEPVNNSTSPSQLSTSAYIKYQTALKADLQLEIDKLEKLNKIADSDKVMRSFDPPETIRIEATVDFEEIDSETVMVIREIHQLDWETMNQ